MVNLKFKSLQEIRQRLLGIGSSENKHDPPIDSGILETCVLLNALGFSTYTSCEGHTETTWGVTMSFVCIANNDLERYRDMKRDFRKLLEDFYKMHGSPEENQIYVDDNGSPIGTWGFCLRAPRTTKSHPDELDLKRARDEIKLFTDYLMRLYLVSAD